MTPKGQYQQIISISCDRLESTRGDHCACLLLEWAPADFGEHIIQEPNLSLDLHHASARWWPKTPDFSPGAIVIYGS